MRRSRHFLVTLVVPCLAIAGIVVIQPEARASNWFGSSGRSGTCASGVETGNTHDGGPHTYYYSDLTSNVVLHQDNAWNSVYGPTSIDPSKLTSVNSLTDVVVYDADFVAGTCQRPWHPQPPGTQATLGLATCVSLAGNSCQKHEIRYDLSWFDNANGDGNFSRRAVVCHETGHTVGLAHTSADNPGSCMQRTNWPSDQITEHDGAHLNGGWQTLYGNQFLYAPQAIVSWNGKWRAIMQWDGNFVVYGPGGYVLSISNTGGWPGAYAVMQWDGNFVIYYPDAYGTFVLCSTKTGGQNGAFMRMQDDGNLVMYRGAPIWASLSGHRCR